MTTIEQFVLDSLNARVKKMEPMEPIESCSMWYYRAIFGGKYEPEELSAATKNLVKLGEIIQTEDSKGVLSLVPKQHFKLV